MKVEEVSLCDGQKKVRHRASFRVDIFRWLMPPGACPASTWDTGLCLWWRPWWQALLVLTTPDCPGGTHFSELLEFFGTMLPFQIVNDVHHFWAEGL